MATVVKYIIPKIFYVVIVVVAVLGLLQVLGLLGGTIVIR